MAVKGGVLVNVGGMKGVLEGVGESVRVGVEVMVGVFVVVPVVVGVNVWLDVGEADGARGVMEPVGVRVANITGVHEGERVEVPEARLKVPGARMIATTPAQ